MADQPAPAAPDAAAGPSGSLLAQLRTLSTTPVADLRQQAGGPAGVVEMLAGLAASSFGKGGGAPPFPVPASSSLASSASDANAAVAAGDADAGAHEAEDGGGVAHAEAGGFEKGGEGVVVDLAAEAVGDEAGAVEI